MAAVVASLSERSLRAMARAAAEAAANKEGIDGGGGGGSVQSDSAANSVSTSSLSPRTSEPTTASTNVTSAYSPAAAAALGPAAPVAAAAETASTSVPPVNMRRVSFSDTVQSLGEPGGAGQLTTLLPKLQKDKSLSLDDLPDILPRGGSEDEDAWPPPEAEVTAGLAARARDVTALEKQQQQQLQQQQRPPPAAAAEAAKPAASRSGKHASQAPEPAPGASAAPAAERKSSRKLAFGSYEFDLESLGLPPGTILDGLDSPTGAGDKGGNGAIAAELQALRDQVSALQVTAAAPHSLAHLGDSDAHCARSVTVAAGIYGLRGSRCSWLACSVSWRRQSSTWPRRVQTPPQCASMQRHYRSVSHSPCCGAVCAT